MLDLALRGDGSLRPIQEIAAGRGMPQRYLEHVLLQLKRAGLLISRRGSAGGYRLSRPPDQITVGAILRAVEGDVPGGEGAPRAGRAAGPDASVLADLWREVDAAVAAVIDRVTLEDLRRRAQDREGAGRLTYHI
jgi:Rrf2 family protein